MTRLRLFRGAVDRLVCWLIKSDRGLAERVTRRCRPQTHFSTREQDGNAVPADVCCVAEGVELLGAAMTFFFLFPSALLAHRPKAPWPLEYEFPDFRVTS